VSTDVITLAHQIAARTAVTDIASHGVHIGNDWYDVTQPSSKNVALDLAESVQYLDLNGLIRRRRDGAIKIRFGRKYPGGKL
jgi:hypothetical protein